MIQTIHSSTPIARKDYHCSACEGIFNHFSYKGVAKDLNLSITEMRALVKAKQNGFRIKKGERYIRQFNCDGGDTWTYRAIPEMDSICMKFKIFEE